MISGPVRRDRFTSLDTLALVREIRGLGRTHVDKAFDGPEGSLSIALRSPSRGRYELLVRPGHYGALLEGTLPHGQEPGPMAREARRLLTGSVLTDVPDPAGERYLELRLARADGPEPITLAVELFGSGNVVIARGDRIVAVAHPKVWAHRSVKVGAEYHAPPPRGNPWTRTAGEIEALLGASRTDLASTLAARWGFGGPIAEELLDRAALPGERPAPTGAAETAPPLHRAISELLSEVGEAPKGYLYRVGEDLLDVEPFLSRRWQRRPEIRVEVIATFSEAAQRFFPTVLASAAPPPPDPLADLRAEVLRQKEQQATAVAELLELSQRLSAEADAIYAHYSAAEELRARAAASSAETDRIEVTLGDRTVPLWVRRPLEESARLLYEEAKRAQSRLAGARVSVEASERRLRELVLPEPGPEDRSRLASPPYKPAWFEKFRWFLSSDGILVIGGRDAVSNDLIVRRYLKSQDLYVHADIHGAPSVIVKHPEKAEAPVPETTLTEAAQFGVAFSKAWRVGLASASAFWVRADQVSKSGGSGEFVARGAWVIHGTKNIVKDVPTEIGLGTVDYEGAARWCAGPPAALRARGLLRAVVTPGDERERADREIELAELLGISRSRVQSLLPAGGVALRRT